MNLQVAFVDTTDLSKIFSLGVFRKAELVAEGETPCHLLHELQNVEPVPIRSTTVPCSDITAARSPVRAMSAATLHSSQIVLTSRLRRSTTAPPQFYRDGAAVRRGKRNPWADRQSGRCPISSEGFHGRRARCRSLQPPEGL